MGSVEMPAALRELGQDQLGALCDEIRRALTETIPQIGGHFASPLGVVELTVALHRVFATPEDRIVWDVGHQGYVHKMLTGRSHALHTIRQSGGISGFLKRGESEFDAFGAGHAGTSISAALGMFLGSRSHRHCVAIIGDGSLTAGMAFEALNHAGGLHLQQPGRLAGFIVVLNDNGMSISENVGALHTQSLAGTGIGQFFSALGFDYTGPLDGHDIVTLERAFLAAKSSVAPVLIHIKTKKGAGSPHAERDPVAWHGIAPPPKVAAAVPSYTAVFSRAITELASADPRIVAITAAMPTGTGLDRFAAAFPDRYFDVGICEQHAVTLAAGMACEGARPVVALYSTFLQRGFDQVVHDVCIQNLPVLFAIDRGGVVGNDGETHQGMFDVSFLRALPNMVVMSPRDESELPRMLVTALAHPGPCAIRFPRGNGIGRELSFKALEIGRASKLRSGRDALLIGFGPIVNVALRVAERAARELGMEVAVIDARFAKPLDRALLGSELPNYPLICTLEEHVLQGGFGAAVLELVHDERLPVSGAIVRFGGGDEFLPHGSQEEQRCWSGIDESAIFRLLELRLLEMQGGPCSVKAVA